MAEASRPEQTQDESDIAEIRQSVSQLCAKYGEDYWLDMDRTNGYPSDFVAELTQAGFLTLLPHVTAALLSNGGAAFTDRVLLGRLRLPMAAARGPQERRHPPRYRGVRWIRSCSPSR